MTRTMIEFTKYLLHEQGKDIITGYYVFNSWSCAPQKFKGDSGIFPNRMLLLLTAVLAQDCPTQFNVNLNQIIQTCTNYESQLTFNSIQIEQTLTFIGASLPKICTPFCQDYIAGQLKNYTNSPCASAQFNPQFTNLQVLELISIAGQVTCVMNGTAYCFNQQVKALPSLNLDDPASIQPLLDNLVTQKTLCGNCSAQQNVLLKQRNETGIVGQLVNILTNAITSVC
ncbi:hypothetical protein HDV04_002557 [Boothiomyces sp. JEL0838]|nr:hypothetical protein HDV04_002557 [Boothiomyces sp. JEL0838]